MTTTFPLCLTCKHFVDDKQFTCSAFVDGIPDEILTGQFDHHEPYPGDHEVRFEPKPGSLYQ